MATATRLDLETFVVMEYPRVVAAVRLITGDYEAAADAVQDAIVGLLSSPPREEPRNYAAWITVVASNNVRGAQRRSGAESRAYAKVGVSPEAHLDALTSLDVDVKAALLALPERQRQVCVMHYLLDQSVESIAQDMGISEGTVKTQLHRSRQALAARIGKEADHG